MLHHLTPGKRKMSSLILPPDLAIVAERDLGETVEVRERCMKELRDKLEALTEADRPHRLDDDYLIAFLRGTKVRTRRMGFAPRIDGDARLGVHAPSPLPPPAIAHQRPTVPAGRGL